MAYPKPIQRLIELFTKLPGIGSRQATRFVFAILKNGLAWELSQALNDLEKIKLCPVCFRSVETETISQIQCSLCRSPKREKNLIAVVEKESDLENFEKTGAYNGVYHVLGGLISPLDSDSVEGLHLKELQERIKNILREYKKCEVILATNATTEGDATALYLERILTPLKDLYPGLVVSRLGRGLSLGSELEYADEITLKNALFNRK